MREGQNSKDMQTLIIFQTNFLSRKWNLLFIYHVIYPEMTEFTNHMIFEYFATYLQHKVLACISMPCIENNPKL